MISGVDMGHPHEISGLIAFTAGLLSFISPCVLPLVPSYVTYITGVSFKELTTGENRSKVRWATILHSLFFIMGFSLIFILLGASATYLGRVLAQYQYWIMKAGGILIILLGIQFTGIIKIPFLQMEKRFEIRKKPIGLAGSLLVGVIFAAGWTPCVGPILTAILMYAATAKNVSKGVVLLIIIQSAGDSFFSFFSCFYFFLSAFDKIKAYEGDYLRERPFPNRHRDSSADRYI